MIPFFNGGAVKWDKGLVLDLLDGRLAAGGHRFTGECPIKFVEGGAVLILPIGKADDDYGIEEVQQQLDRMDWAVVLATSDECSVFPWKELQHPNMRLWIQTPRPELHFQHDRFLVHGTPPRTPEIVDKWDVYDKRWPWMFAGQVNHDRRRRMAKALRGAKLPGYLLESEGFSQGMTKEDYILMLAATKIAPCPSGPCTPDSFRLWEALEAGCVPIVDDRCPAYGPGYWPLVLGEIPPFPLIEDWSNIIDFIDFNLAQWPANATRCSAWWQRYKRDLHWRINDDVSEVSGIEAPLEDVTVLIPTSPIASHPSVTMIEETVASIRFWLPHSEIIFMCDGVREEQEEYRERYEEYLHKLVWCCEHRWANTYPMIFDEHTHQIGMTRAALDKVRTPLVLFVEHDTPLVTDEEIDFPEAIKVLKDGGLNVLKFHHEALILQVHKHLMLDHVTVTAGELPIRKTRQWSQRPNLARTDYYRWMMQRLEGRRGMIEDHWGGFVETEPWGAHRVAIYHPPGKAGIKRSLNLDGRGDDPKWVDS